MKKSAFSIVELMVAVTILVILSTIGFISYSAYVATARDTQRKAHLAEIKGAMKILKQARGLYPEPIDSFEITYNGTPIVKQ
jgi:prepilin-type N-terminal cleavage/methylation domain-containing protein